MYDENIKSGTKLDKILTKVSKKLLKNKLKIDKSRLRKLNYKRDITNNNICIHNKIIGKYNTRGGPINFN